MYVCICRGITQKQLEDAVSTRRGQSSKDVLKALGIGSDCGTCVEDAVQQLLDASSKTPRQAQATPVPSSSSK